MCDGRVSGAYLVTTTVEGGIGAVSTTVVGVALVMVVMVAVRMGRELTMSLVRGVMIIFRSSMYLQGRSSCFRHEGGDVEIADIQGRPSHTI